jgi:hypothetical protein
MGRFTWEIKRTEESTIKVVPTDTKYEGVEVLHLTHKKGL